MCGRFTLEKPLDAIQLRFDLDPGLPAPAHGPRYNIAPGQTILTVVQGDGGRRLVGMRWGLVPSWQQEPKPGPINARAETVAQRPMFREAYRRRRCLIPADGFYEWQPADTPKGPKQPFRFTRVDRELFAFAGIWEQWLPRGAPPGTTPLLTCSLLTTEPNELVRPVHDRMPLILGAASEETWLRGELVQPLPYPAAAMTVYPVSTRVNSPRHDDPQCAAPLPHV